MTIEEYIIHGHEKVNGWFSPDAMRIIKSLSDIQTNNNIQSDILEIGIYQGKSAIFLSMLLTENERLHVVDIFKKDDLYYGLNDREIFEKNINQYCDTNRIDIFPLSSSEFFKIDYDNYVYLYRLIHIDGSHEKKDVIDDLYQSSDILSPQGLIILDDLFNPQHPGVMEGFMEYALQHPCYPFIIGHNKLIFAIDNFTYSFYKERFKPELYGEYITRNFIDDTEVIIFI